MENKHQSSLLSLLPKNSRDFHSLISPPHTHPPTPPKPPLPLQHKVVVVGDTWALGVGDWILAGQIAGVSSSILKAAALDRTRIKQRWYVVNQGVNGTSTEDWIPGGGEGEGQVAGEVGKEEKKRKREGKGEGGEIGEGGKWWRR